MNVGVDSTFIYIYIYIYYERKKEKERKKFILLCFNVLSTVPRENRLADFLYIYIYIHTHHSIYLDGDEICKIVKFPKISHAK